MPSSFLNFVSNVERLGGKKRGRKPIFNAHMFFPVQLENELIKITREEFKRAFEENVALALQGFYDDVDDLTNAAGDLDPDFIKKVSSLAEAVGVKAGQNFSKYSEMLVGQPYFPPAAKSDIFNAWKSNFQQLCKSAEEDTKTNISRIVTQAKMNGWNKNQLEKAIRAELPEKTKKRAELIARTEMGKLNSAANLATYKEVGIEYYVWMTTLDGRERESHKAMNGRICSVDDPTVYFEETEHGLEKHMRSEVGGYDEGHPGDDFQCRCSMVAWSQALDGKYEVKETVEEDKIEYKSTSQLLAEAKEELERANEKLLQSNRKNEILQAANKRHESRSVQARNGILKRLQNRLDIRRRVKEAIAEATGVNGIDLDVLIELQKGGSKKQYVKMNSLAADIHDKIAELNSFKYVQNGIQVAKDFDYQTAVAVEKSVEKKLDHWKSKNLSNTDLKGRLEDEIKWVEDKKSYASWKVAQDAYKKLLIDVNKDIQIEAVNAELPALKAYAATHKKFKNYPKWISDLENMIADKNVYSEFEIKKQFDKVKNEQVRIKQWDPVQVVSGKNNVTSAKYKVDNGIQKAQMPHEMKQSDAISAIKELTLVDDKTAQDFYDAVRGFSYQWDYEIRAIQCGTNFTSRHGHSMAEIQKKADDIEKFIASSPKWGGGTTYRGISLSLQSLNDYNNAMKMGLNIDMKGSASWSVDEGVSKGFSDSKIGDTDLNGNKITERVMLVNTKGQPLGTSISHISNYSYEDEILCSKDSRYKIVGYNKVVNGSRTFHYFTVEPQ